MAYREVFERVEVRIFGCGREVEKKVLGMWKGTGGENFGDGEVSGMEG